MSGINNMPDAPNTTRLPGDPKLSAKVLEQQALVQVAQSEGGKLGGLIGVRGEKAGNVAALVAAAAVGLIAISLILPESTSFPKKDAVLAFISLITGALGFLFGRGSAKN